MSQKISPHRLFLRTQPTSDDVKKEEYGGKQRNSLIRKSNTDNTKNLPKILITPQSPSPRKKNLTASIWKKKHLKTADTGFKEKSQRHTHRPRPAKIENKKASLNKAESKFAGAFKLKSNFRVKNHGATARTKTTESSKMNFFSKNSPEMDFLCHYSVSSNSSANKNRSLIELLLWYFRRKIALFFMIRSVLHLI